MGKSSHFFLSLLFSITLLMTIVSLTLCNERYVLKVGKHLEVEEYVRSGYDEEVLKEETYTRLYLGKKKTLENLKWGMYLGTILLLLLTGELFLHTKKKHQLKTICLMSGVLLIFFFGGFTLCEKEGSLLFHTLYQTTNHIVLACGIFLLEVGLFCKRKTKRSS